MQARIFSHACVRDLAWAAFSPALLVGPDFRGVGLRYPGFWEARLVELDADPGPLQEFLGDAAEGRLGLYYERLWQYLLEQDPDIDLLAHNLPVRDGNRTVGEFDCLLWSESEGVHIHLELAVKFYLGQPESGTWLGPDRRDRLDIKLERLLGHQAQLARHAAAEEPLEALGIGDCESRIALRGYLFTPAAGMSPPDQFNPELALQRWYPLTDFLALPALPAEWAGWQKIPRRRWLSPFHAGDGKLRDPDALAQWLQDRMAGSARPAQLAACDADGIEQFRCFVTPDGWPPDVQA